jgi:hypothetical protein
MAYHGADQSYTDVNDGFWGSARDFSQPPASRRRIIIVAAMYVHDLSIAANIAQLRAAEIRRQQSREKLSGVPYLFSNLPSPLAQFSNHNSDAESAGSDAIEWLNAQLIDEDGEAYGEKPFKFLDTAQPFGTATPATATLVVDDPRAGNVNNGDPITVRVNFVLPEYGKSISSYPNSFVKLPGNNRFGFYARPMGKELFEFHHNKRAAYAQIHLHQVNAEARNSYFIISVRGHYGNGDVFASQARVGLRSRNDLPRPRFPGIPFP